MTSQPDTSRRGRPPALTPSAAAALVAMHRKGWSITDLTHSWGVSASTVRRIIATHPAVIRTPSATADSAPIL
ncbi:helix-turn-helix domain-containing protein [Tsukamurella soli]|uniref:helix-turn-helix domain-containing protein n=1 Tax=Tsukamurella soli TaxID=644556 RepID=UPI003CD08DB1